MQPPVSDPAGILARIPELQPLLEDRAVRRAVERGKPHAVYRALSWARLTGRLRQQREVIDGLLANRRLFLEPLSGAPALFTVNGVGSTMFGRTEWEDDGTYLKTLFLVFFFLPIFPLTTYLVRDSGRGWSFMAKAPHATLHWAWRRLVAAAILLVVLGGAASTLRSSMVRTLHVVNALDVPVVARIGMREVRVPGRGVVAVTVGTGTEAVVVRDAETHAVVERGSIRVPAGAAAAWNVAGAGIVYRETVVYSASGESPPQGGSEVACGRAAVIFEDVDFPFEEPPRSIEMSQGSSSTTRTHAGVALGDTFQCVSYLASHDDDAGAARLAESLAHVLGMRDDAVGVAVQAVERARGAEAAVTLAREALRAHDGSLSAHRIYQGAMIRAGRRDAVVAEYEARLASAPDSPDASYLRWVLAPRAVSLPKFVELAARFPSHARIHRALAFGLADEHRFAEAVQAYDELHVLDAQSWKDGHDTLLYALVGAGRTQEAVALVADGCRSATEEAALYACAVEYAKVARGMGSDEAQRDAERSAPQGAPHTWMKLRAGLPVAPQEVEALDDRGNTIDWLARDRPSDALRHVADARHGDLGNADPVVLAMLRGEALRVEPDGAAAQRLADACPLGRRNCAAVDQYFRDGIETLDVEELSPDLRAALYFVRSRDARLHPATRASLRDAACADDVFHGPVTLAIAGWPE